MEGFKNKDDGLSYICEECGDRENGCFACGYGKRQKREKSDIESWEDFEDKRPATKEDIDKFAKDMKELFDGIK
jgi:hypothetical protein